MTKKLLAVAVLAALPLALTTPAQAATWKPKLVKPTSTDVLHARQALSVICLDTEPGSEEEADFILSFCYAGDKTNKFANRVGWCARWVAQKHKTGVSETCLKDTRQLYRTGL